MIDQQLIDMLDDPNPQVRIKAVKQLAKTQSQDAVRYLAVLYKSDDDPEVRELARKAGLYIKKKMTEDAWTGGDADPNAIDEPEPSDEINVSSRAVEASKGQMESAMNVHMAGDDAKAAKFVEKAFLGNPNLKNDPYYLGLAATILGLPGDQVADFLLGDMEYDAKSGKPKRKRKPKNGEGEDGVTTEMVVIDLVIFWVVVAAIFILGVIIFFQLLSSSFEGLPIPPGVTSELTFAEEMEFQELFTVWSNIFIGAGIISSIIYSFIMSVFSVIGLLIQFAFYHFAASTILGGEGTFKGLIHKLTNFHTATYAISAIASYFMLYWVINTVIELPPDADVEVLGGGLLVIYGLSFLVSIVWTFYLSLLIGKNYDFGTGKGCLTIIVSSLLMSALSCACTVVFSVVLGQMFASIMIGASGF